MRSGARSARSVAVLALEGGEHEVAHVVDVALDAFEPVVIDAPVLVAALLDAQALGLEFLLELVQQRLVGETPCASRLRPARRQR